MKDYLNEVKMLDKQGNYNLEWLAEYKRRRCLEISVTNMFPKEEH